MDRCKTCGHPREDHEDGPCTATAGDRIDARDSDEGEWVCIPCPCPWFTPTARKRRTPEELTALAELLRRA